MHRGALCALLANLNAAQRQCRRYADGLTRVMVIAWFASVAGATTYYLDCNAGNDNATGTSPDQAWRTLERANRQSLGPGDALLIRRGTRCSGTLKLQGSGALGRPARIGSYGDGPLPVIDARGAIAALEIEDQQHWVIESLEFTGGTLYGIHVSARRGTTRGIELRNVVVHGVHGELKTKSSGLIAVLGHEPESVLERITIDGATCYDTSQWAGIIVRGASRENRARQITIRNSIVHHVYGDGIVLFQVEDGLIEYSAAWLTGLQPRETIGTPNGIWTWRCRRCTVQWTEGFWIDSPGVDGGVYDIDWGNEDNIVQYNFGHDAQGYCASVFGAQGEVTVNSVIRYNVCVNNGRSPKLARRQGEIYISTWDKGSIDAVRIHNNTIYWNPPIEAPVLQIDQADFTGPGPNLFERNVIYSTSPLLIHSNLALKFDGNLYWQVSGKPPRWEYGQHAYHDWRTFQQKTGQELQGRYQDPLLNALLVPRAGSPALDAVRCDPTAKVDAFGHPLPQGKNCDLGAIEALPPAPDTRPRRFVREAIPKQDIHGRSTLGVWTLLSFLAPDSALSRSQLVFLKAALVQYRGRGLRVLTVWPLKQAELIPLSYELDLGEVLAVADPERSIAKAHGVESYPASLLVDNAGRVIERWDGFAAPAHLGLLLRTLAGPPPGSPAVDLPLPR